MLILTLWGMLDGREALPQVLGKEESVCNCKSNLVNLNSIKNVFAGSVKGGLELEPVEEGDS